MSRPQLVLLVQPLLPVPLMSSPPPSLPPPPVRRWAQQSLPHSQMCSEAVVVPEVPSQQEVHPVHAQTTQSLHVPHSIARAVDKLSSR